MLSSSLFFPYLALHPAHSSSPCSIFMPRMDTGKNGAGKCSFSVVRVRDEVVVSPGWDPAKRDEEKADAALARGMKDLSLSREKNDGSARLGCVSKIGCYTKIASLIYTQT